jgi:uncharacterized SAM-binding protein YcdF (DUF218 family)
MFSYPLTLKFYIETSKGANDIQRMNACQTVFNLPPPAHTYSHPARAQFCLMRSIFRPFCNKIPDCKIESILMPWFATNLLSTLFLPPFSLLILALTGAALLYRHPGTGKGLLFTAFTLLWLASTPYFAEGALHLLEAKTSALKTTPQGPAAIVVLGGGTYFNAPEYSGADTISDATLVRLRYGARLARESKLPILVTGGKPLGNQVSEADQMKLALEEDFRVPVRWTEGASDNTFENAQYSYATLKKAGINKIYLVTHGWHMARSSLAFKNAGFEVIEAPTAFTTRYQIDALAFVPRAESLRDSKIFVHEVIGLLVYQAKSLISQNTRN